MNYVRWVTIREFRDYEISSEGQVRRRGTEKLLGRIWVHRKDCYRKEIINDTPSEPIGSLCVRLRRDGRQYMRRIWRLMDQYLPNVPYPRYWKAEVYRDGRRKLTPEQTREIVYSPLSPTELHKSGKYPVGRRYISKLKNRR